MSSGCRVVSPGDTKCPKQHHVVGQKMEISENAFPGQRKSQEGFAEVFTR